MGAEVARPGHPAGPACNGFGRCVDLAAVPLTGPLTGTPEAGAVLAGSRAADHRLGLPAAHRGRSGAAPRLRAVVHAAGSVKSPSSRTPCGSGPASPSPPPPTPTRAPSSTSRSPRSRFAAKKALSVAARYSGGWPALHRARGRGRPVVGIIGASRIGRARASPGSRASDASYRTPAHRPVRHRARGRRARR